MYKHNILWFVATIASIAAAGMLAVSVLLAPIFGDPLSSIGFVVAFVLICLTASAVKSEFTRHDARFRACQKALARQDDLIYRLEQRIRDLSRELDDQVMVVDPRSILPSDTEPEHVKRTAVG